MKRWAANLFCLFSLLVLATSVTIWVRSYYMADTIEHWGDVGNSKAVVGGHTGAIYDIQAARGALGWCCETHDYPSFGGMEPGWHYQVYPLQFVSDDVSAVDQTVDFQLLGIKVSHGFIPVNNGGTRWQRTKIPLWLFLPAAVPPFLWWRKWRKKGGRGFPVNQTMNDERGTMKVEEDQRIV